MKKPLVDLAATERLMQRVEEAKQAMGKEYLLHPDYTPVQRHSTNPAIYWPHLRATPTAIHA